MFIEIDEHDDDPSPDILGMGDPDTYEGDSEEPEETYTDRQLSNLLTKQDPQLSLAEIDKLLSEPRKLLQLMNRRTLQQLERDVWELVHGYPMQWESTRCSMLEVAENPQHTPLIQMVVLIRAVESFSSFVTIRCNDDRSLERFVFDYADASWWAEIWDDLVKAHGDQTPSFFI